MFPNGILKLKYQLNFQWNNGDIVAITKEQNNKDSEIKVGNISIGSKIPTKILFEKSGEGNSKRPKNKPINIEKIASFS